MMDANYTHREWKESESDILFLPIGAMEQHGSHLPLNTDTLISEFFSKKMAADLKSDCLPAMNYGTSLEHKGFKGSFSLSPESLMGIVEDIGLQALEQSYRFLIIHNGHGGNHSLIPASRKLNRKDLGIKIMPLSYFDFLKPPLGMGEREDGWDFHGGDMETSLMLAIHPEYVKMEYAEDHQVCNCMLNQTDLTWMGMSHLHPSGVVGFPTQASRDKGERIIHLAMTKMLTYLKERIQYLRSHPLY